MSSGANIVPAGEAEPRIWAAEELALQAGWLRECPYHGAPFKRSDVCADSAGDLQADSELREFALRLTRTYDEECAFCARENAIPE
jgi:hypothetical protein